MTQAVLAELQAVMPSVRKVWADGGYGEPELARARTGMPAAPNLEIVQIVPKPEG